MFKKLFGKRKFQRFNDSFALTKAKKLETLCQWVRQQSAKGERVVVLSHFQSSFLDNQAALQDAGIDFDILAETLNEDQFVQRAQRETPAGRVILTMGPMLAPGDFPAGQPQRTASQDAMIPISVIVTERYPLITRDRKLEKFFEQIHATVLMGYLISFDDPILVRLLDQRFVDLLKQLGLGDNELISSVMTHRGLSRKLQQATTAIQQERPAASPQEWIKLNLDAQPGS